jgi:DNA-binding MarR family transcriptional regulator
MSRDTNAQPPIGYWLKHADEVITKHVNQALRDQGLTQFHWQMLNITHEAGVTSWAQVFGTMQSFVDAIELDQIISDFVQRGWMIRRAQAVPMATELELTDQGNQEFTRIFTLQRAVRQQAFQGITPEEYTTVIDVLQRMVSNLE